LTRWLRQQLERQQPRVFWVPSLVVGVQNKK
jgi:hypothetical protein